MTSGATSTAEPPTPPAVDRSSILDGLRQWRRLRVGIRGRAPIVCELLAVRLGMIQLHPYGWQSDLTVDLEAIDSVEAAPSGDASEIAIEQARLEASW